MEGSELKLVLEWTEWERLFEEILTWRDKFDIVVGVYGSEIPNCTTTINLTETAAARNEVALSYYSVRGLYVWVVVFAATIKCLADFMRIITSFSQATALAGIIHRSLLTIKFRLHNKCKQYQYG